MMSDTDLQTYVDGLVVVDEWLLLNDTKLQLLIVTEAGRVHADIATVRSHDKSVWAVNSTIDHVDALEALVIENTDAVKALYANITVLWTEVEELNLNISLH